MWNNAFLDYLEIRRRIERRLPGMLWVWVHLAPFLAVVIMLLGVNSAYIDRYPDPPYFLVPGLGLPMTFWSIALLLHGLWSYRRSAAMARTREQGIDQELRERIEQDDTMLLADPRRVFRIRGLLDEDIRQRSGLYMALLAFLLLNAATWIVWASKGADDSYTWQMTIPTVIVFLLPALALNMWRRRRRDHKLERLMAERKVDTGKSKRKLSFDDMAEAAVRLSDDGELVPFDDAQREANPVKK
jgi:2TM domain